MGLDRSMVGLESEEMVFEVEKGAIRKFAEAIGATTEEYLRGEMAPPTFPTTFRVPLEGLSIEASRVLHGEQEYVFHRPIRPGDRLRCKSRVADVYEKEGRSGRMTFVVTETEGRDEAGELVFVGRSTIIVR